MNVSEIYNSMTDDQKQFMSLLIAVTLKNSNKPLSQGTKFVRNYLVHHGVKGQKWGVHTKGDSSSDYSQADAEDLVKSMMGSLSETFGVDVDDDQKEQLVGNILETAERFEKAR